MQGLLSLLFLLSSLLLLFLPLPSCGIIYPCCSGYRCYCFRHFAACATCNVLVEWSSICLFLSTL